MRSWLYCEDFPILTAMCNMHIEEALCRSELQLVRRFISGGRASLVRAFQFKAFWNCSGRTALFRYY